MIKIINRSMSIPIPDRVIGYVGDNLVETRIFELGRFYNGIDLSEFEFKLDTEINGVKNIILLDKSVEDNKIILTWTIAESHVLNAGHMNIQIRAFKGEVEKWHSNQDYVIVRESINASQSIPSPLPSEFEQYEQRIKAMRDEAALAAQTATEQAEIVVEVVEEAKTDVLPELHQAIEDAGNVKSELDSSIQEAGSAKSALDGSISAAGHAKTGLDDSISSAGVAKTQLDESISSANGIKSQLDGSITAAEQTKQALDESIATGDLDSFKADYMQFKNDSTLESAKIKKELNDYKATMQQVNIHQSPTQKASGHGIVSLPPNAAEGQVSVTAKGLTATNIINNGNFANGTSGWRGTNATISVSNNVMQVVSDGSANIGWLIQDTSYPIFPSRKYFIKAKLRVTNNDCVRMRALIRSTGGSGDNVYVIAAPVANQWYSLAIILDSQATHAGNFRLLFSHDYADTATANGKIMEVQEVMVIDLIAHGLESKTVEELAKMFANYFDGTKSTVCAFRIRSVSEDESQESVVYVLAKDDEGNIEELRSLPNGTKDEIDVTRGKLIKRVSDEIALSNLTWSNSSSGETTNYWSVVSNSFLPTGDSHTTDSIRLKNYNETTIVSSLTIYNETDGRIVRRATNVGNIYIKIPKSEINGTIDNAKAKAWFEQNQITLTYQLAEPIEIPVQVSGSIVSYPNGTIFIERILPDAGVYTDKISVLHQDAPIKRLDRLSKVDFYTGVETELDVSEAVIAEDKLSFTHPDLSEGDIVFFEYEYDVESTDGEAEVEFYDSRYVVKDTETGKFYKWNIVVANGQPSIELVEV